jgi:hypothetical protein
MKRVLLLLVPLLVVLAGAGLYAFAPGAPAAEIAAGRPAGVVRPVVIEMFTSQGCSSCPPADAALARFAEDPYIVALTRPVTYWDNLGWHDRLARPENDALQRAYLRRLGSSDEPYTPEAVVQGRQGLVGGRTGAIHRAIDEDSNQAGPLLRIAPAGGGRLLTLDGTAARPAEIRLVALRTHVSVMVGGGENGGHRLDFVNVVIGEQVIGAWHGGALRLPLPAARLHVPGADRYAIIVQEPDAGPILTVSYL